MTGERIAAPESVDAWASIADQDAWNAQLEKDPLRFWRSCGERLAWDTPAATTLEGVSVTHAGTSAGV